MAPFKRLLLVLPLGFCAHAAFAATPASGPENAKPKGSPADWVGAVDYPAIALRSEMAGATAFKLTIDATGEPTHCDIVRSSGFDILDNATCDLLMARARFAPARNRAGKPVEGSFRSAVRWVLPDSSAKPVTERLVSIVMSIDRSGDVTSCRIEPHFPVEMTTEKIECDAMSKSPPRPAALEFRRNSPNPSADVEVLIADVFTPELRARALAPMPGYEQRSLNIFRFTLTREGKRSECAYEEQRGSETAVSDFCRDSRNEVFDPPFSAFDKDGVATGWHIMRVMLKTAQ